MKKSIFVWALLLCLLTALLPVAAMAANQPTFFASSASGCAGSTVDVTFSIKNNTDPGLVGAELKGTYDASKLEFVSAKNGSVMSSPICNTKDGNIYYSWDDSLTSGIVGDGVMCTLTFKIKDTCKPGDKIAIQLTQFKAHDTDLNDVTVTVTGGTVTVSDHTWGKTSYSWSGDNKTCTATRKQTCGCGGTETETATASVKEETKQTTYTATFKNDAFSTQTKKVTAEPIKVTFRLIGATLSKKGVDLSNGGTSDSEYVTWIPTTAYTMDAGSSAYELIKKAMDAAGLEYTMTSSYLSSVNAPAVLDGYELAEFTNGSRSGWMFTVNGKHGSLSIGQQELKDGDVLIVHYVNDYLYEETKFPWLNAKDIAPSKPINPQPTEPKPTEPKPTEPKPTEPQPTEPKPTEPKPTEPKPTEPKPTEPKPTEPQPTEPKPVETKPTDPQPTAPSISTDPTDPSNPGNSTDPSEPNNPTNPSDMSTSNAPKDDAKKCTCWCCRFWWLLFLVGMMINGLMIWGIPVLIRKFKKKQ